MFHPLYKFVSPETLEKRHRKITESMKELGNIPEEQLPPWALGGKNESYRIIYDIIANYENTSDNNYNDWCRHIERLKEIAEKSSLKLQHSADYANFYNRFGRNVATILYSTLSHTPDMTVIKNTNQAKIIIDECMQDFKKAF